MATPKQEKAFAATLENLGNKGKALREAGYAESVVKNPKIVTDSKGWQELKEKYLPDSMLVKVHTDGLADNDAGIRHKYLDTAYKVKGSYAAEKYDHTTLGKEIKSINYVSPESRD